MKACDWPGVVRVRPGNSTSSSNSDDPSPPPQPPRRCYQPQRERDLREEVDEAESVADCSTTTNSNNSSSSKAATTEFAITACAVSYSYSRRSRRQKSQIRQLLAELDAAERDRRRHPVRDRETKSSRNYSTDVGIGRRGTKTTTARRRLTATAATAAKRPPPRLKSPTSKYLMIFVLLLFSSLHSSQFISIEYFINNAVYHLTNINSIPLRVSVRVVHENDFKVDTKLSIIIRCC